LKPLRPIAAVAPFLLGKFVEKQHFFGICYKAAKWISGEEIRGQGRKRYCFGPTANIC
jgi:hypothetical protein